MQQRINLLLLLPKYQLVRFSLTVVATINGVLILLLLLVALFTYFTIHQKRQQLKTLQVNDTTISAQLAEIEKKYPENARVLQLQQQITDLTKEMEEKSSLMALLSQNQAQNILGFSHYLQVFAEKIVPGVALTLIRLDEGGRVIVLEGEALDTASALSFVKQLNQGVQLGSETFKLSQIGERSKEGYLTIRLSNNGSSTKRGTP